jgi:hypothetical protein
MSKRPSLFTKTREAAAEAQSPVPLDTSSKVAPEGKTNRPPSRAGKRVFSTYLDPIPWKQLRQLALDNETSMQALGEEALNLLFEKYRINRSA